MYIINSEGIAYHQHAVLYIIKPQENTRWRVMRYKGGFPPLMIYAALRASMICQACGLDKQKGAVKKVPEKEKDYVLKNEHIVFFCGKM